MKRSEISINMVKGMSAKEAFDQVIQYKPNIVQGSNCTNLWKKAKSPLPGTELFKQFCFRQLVKKTKLEPGIGLYIVMDRNARDTRANPYKIIRKREGKGTRKYRRIHQISEANIEVKNGEPIVKSIGSPLNIEFPTYKDALETVKKLTTETHKNYVIQTIKVSSDSIEAVCMYKPSCRAKEGTFVCFGINQERITI